MSLTFRENCLIFAKLIPYLSEYKLAIARRGFSRNARRVNNVIGKIQNIPTIELRIYTAYLDTPLFPRIELSGTKSLKNGKD